MIRYIFNWNNREEDNKNRKKYLRKNCYNFFKFIEGKFYI